MAFLVAFDKVKSIMGHIEDFSSFLYFNFGIKLTFFFIVGRWQQMFKKYKYLISSKFTKKNFLQNGLQAG